MCGEWPRGGQRSRGLGLGRDIGGGRRPCRQIQRLGVQTGGRGGHRGGHWPLARQRHLEVRVLGDWWARAWLRPGRGRAGARGWGGLCRRHRDRNVANSVVTGLWCWGLPVSVPRGWNVASGAHQQRAVTRAGLAPGPPLQDQVGQPLVPLRALPGPGDGRGPGQCRGQHGGHGRGGQLRGQDAAPCPAGAGGPRHLLGWGRLVAVLAAAVPELLVVHLALEAGDPAHVEGLRGLLQRSLEQRMLLLQTLPGHLSSALLLFGLCWAGGQMMAGLGLLRGQLPDLVLETGPGAWAHGGVCTLGLLRLWWVNAGVAGGVELASLVGALGARIRAGGGAGHSLGPGLTRPLQVGRVSLPAGRHGARGCHGGRREGVQQDAANPVNLKIVNW